MYVCVPEALITPARYTYISADYASKIYVPIMCIYNIYIFFNLCTDKHIIYMYTHTYICASKCIYMHTYIDVRV